MHQRCRECEPVWDVIGGPVSTPSDVVPTVGDNLEALS